MPDVKLFGSGAVFDALSLAQEEALAHGLMMVVAREMSCLDNSGDMYTLDPETEIDFVIIRAQEEEIVFNSGTDVLLEISAYDFPDRMRNITDRLIRIGEHLKVMLPPGHQKVSVTFFPIREGHWVAV